VTGATTKGKPASLSATEVSNEGAPQTVERRGTRGAEPGLLVEVVDRDETAEAGLVGDLPVVAAPAHGGVLGRVDTEVPPVAKTIDDRANFEAVGLRPHSTNR
jgi:hypothetical protein